MIQYTLSGISSRAMKNDLRVNPLSGGLGERNWVVKSFLAPDRGDWKAGGASFIELLSKDLTVRVIQNGKVEFPNLSDAVPTLKTSNPATDAKRQWVEKKSLAHHM